MEVSEAHTQGLDSPCRWSSVPLAPTVKHLLKTVETLLLLSVLQVGSAQEGKVLGVPQMLPPHLTIEAEAERKWFHSPSLAVDQVPQGNCWEVVMVALLGVPQEVRL